MATEAENRKAMNRRKDIAAWTAIAIGLALGLFLRRIRFGLLIGLVLGATAVYLFTRKRR